MVWITSLRLNKFLNSQYLIFHFGLLFVRCSLLECQFICESFATKPLTYSMAYCWLPFQDKNQQKFIQFEMIIVIKSSFLLLWLIQFRFDQPVVASIHLQMRRENDCCQWKPNLFSFNVFPCAFHFFSHIGPRFYFGGSNCSKEN